MKRLQELAVRESPALLHEAWEAEQSFVLLPEKPGVSEAWLEDALGRLPDTERQGHFVMLTSGTTGSPKLVVGSRSRSEALARVLHSRQQSEPVEETLVLLPLSYTYSFVNQWLWARVHRRKLQLTAGLSDPRALGDALARASNAMVCLVGVQVPLFERHFGGVQFPGVIRVHFAGGRFPQERLAAIHELFPNAEVYNNYGCAEAMPRLTTRRADEADSAADIGFPLPGVELRSTPDGALLFRSPYGAVGVVEGGRYAAIGREDWVASGDLGERTDRGTWRLLGRVSEVFKRHGERVSLPALVSTVTAVWTGSFAFYRESDRLGEEGCVLTFASAVDAGALQKVLLALRRGHPRAHWPLRVEAVDSLPLLPNGKLDVRALREVSGKTILWRQHI
jgi:long-chain acyl-CoA synthetase